ncbi:MAG: hypothetical protein HYZ53_11205 [Planctomycetes bacterium]|nr:hypothetical protein [Planctomycetota bacterium]
MRGRWIVLFGAALLGLSAARYAAGESATDESDSPWLEIGYAGKVLTVTGCAQVADGTCVDVALELDGSPVPETRRGRVKAGRFQVTFAFGAACLLPGRYRVHATLLLAERPAASTSFRVGTEVEEAASRGAFLAWLRTCTEEARRLETELTVVAAGADGTELPEEWHARRQELRDELRRVTAPGRYVALYPTDGLQHLLLQVARLNPRTRPALAGVWAVPAAEPTRTDSSGPGAAARSARARRLLGEVATGSAGGGVWRAAARRALEELVPLGAAHGSATEIEACIAAVRACLRELDANEAAAPGTSPRRLREERAAYLRRVLADLLARLRGLLEEEG